MANVQHADILNKNILNNGCGDWKLEEVFIARGSEARVALGYRLVRLLRFFRA